MFFVISVNGICRGEFIEVDFPRFSNINDNLWLDVAKRFKKWSIIWVKTDNLTDNLCNILGRRAA